MFSRKENFEIYCLKDGRWLIETSISDAQEAETYARRMLEKREIEGVKVVRERSGGSTTTESTVFSKVKEKRDEKSTIGRTDLAPMCNSMEDVYGLSSRMVLNRLFRQYLDKLSLTPIEVLHNAREIKRVEDQDTLIASAIGQISVLQAAGGGQSSLERRDALYCFLGDIARKARDVEKTQLPSIKQVGVDKLAAAIMKVAGDDPAQADYLFRVSISRDLIEIRSYLGKLDHLLMWIEDSHDDVATDILDDFVGDVLGTTSVIQELLGEQPNLAAAMNKLLDLALDQWEAPPPQADARANARANARGSAVEDERFGRIARLSEAGRLPNCQKVLLERVRQQLCGANPLVRSNPAGDVTAFRQLLDRLIPENGQALGGTDIVDALVQRKMRILNRGGAAGYLAAAKWIAFAMDNPVRKARYLIAISQAALGKQFLAETLTLIESVFVKVDSISDIVTAPVPPNEKMAIITQVWNEIRHAPLPLENVNRICARLDDLLLHYIKTERIIEKIVDADRPLRLRAMMVMKLCLPTSLPPGKASNQARELIVSMLKRPNFEDEIVADITDPAEKANAQRDLFALMRHAGFV